MTLELQIRNDSTRKRLYARSDLQTLAEAVLRAEGEKGRLELSLLFCDDGFIRELNRDWRGIDAPTDVLSFPQEEPDPGRRSAPLGDIVISLETVERRCAGDRAAMRREVRLLFVHGLLHLLGYDHATARQRREMAARQAQHLGIPVEAAWLEE